MKKWIFTGFIGALAFFYLAAFLEFIAGARGFTGIEAKEAQAIVVLTGGINRAEEGLKIFSKEKASYLIISGVHMDADLDSIFPGKLNNVRRDNIILEKKSGSTFENAIEVRDILAKREIRSIQLVTSAYHMKRAYFTFRKILPPEIEIYPMPVSTPNYDERRWWNGKSLMLLAIEFFKYQWYIVKFIG